MLFNSANIVGLVENPTAISVIVLWVLFWKAVALWTAARRGHRLWFVLMLILSTLGILEIIYIASYGREKKETFAHVVKNFFGPVKK